jgi:hypothetical protein
MQEHVIAIMAAIVMGGLPVSIAVAARPSSSRPGGRRASEADPVVRWRIIMNGNFDWRRRGEPVPWYGRGYSDNMPSTQNAYR